ncbi:DUF1249 domain-containing protein [Methylomarinum sp. Ch1-1]|uniref:DUF1249 domain-containing protein n=1 Tax=Methylomarinum roseum TaxID=3067653 RepID=A0AAU7NYH3_9GAMM|nr:DUF1249 domain-containing protein [Methylomarinum sp. Ch1-1]MDP4521851.1 DUF1249 domain-containing protein [Methylomarinum sp. Ch1-1]
MSLVHPVNTSLCLEKLCESNYQKLFRLIPNLERFDKKATGYTGNQPALHLNVLEHNPYTMTIELSHCFNHQLEEFMEPAVKIRLYLDAQLAEVLRDHARHDVHKVYRCPSQTQEIMDYKWRLNYFLQKWLDHCLQHKYRFSEQQQELVYA